MNPATPKQQKWYRRWGCLIPLLVVSLPICAIGFALVQGLIESNRPTYYKNGADFPLDDLPESAHDVRLAPSVSFSPIGRAYEFKCSEDDYRSWVEKTRKGQTKLSEIRVEDRGLHPSISQEGVLELEVVGDFLVSDWRFEDQGFYLIYDKKASRAVRWAHSR